MYQTVIEWLKNHMLTCPSKHLMHMDCPGCGMQRSLLSLLDGDIQKSFQLYPALIPMIFLITFALLHLKFDYKYGANIIKWTQAFCACVIIVFYIYKIITHKIF